MAASTNRWCPPTLARVAIGLGAMIAAQACTSTSPSEASPEPAAAVPDPPAAPTPTPPASARDAMIEELVLAIGDDDVDGLATLMADPFQHLPSASPQTREDAIAKWRQAPESLDKVVAWVMGACGDVGAQWVCPAPSETGSPTPPDDFVAFAPIDGAWRWTAFVADPESPAVSLKSSTHVARRTRYWIRRARAAVKAGELRAALVKYGRADDYLTSSVSPCEAARVHLDLDEVDEAWERAARGLRHPMPHAASAACLRTMAEVHARRGDTARALRAYKRSWDEQPEPVVRQAMERLAPGGTCLPPPRVLDESREQCGLPLDFTSCGVDEFDEPLRPPEPRQGFRRVYDGHPLAEGLRLEVVPTGENLSRRLDLILEDSRTRSPDAPWSAKRSLLATLGWSHAGFLSGISIYRRVQKVTYRDVDLVAGGSKEVTIAVTSGGTDDRWEPHWDACARAHAEESGAFDACMAAAIERASQPSTTYFACGEVQGRWVCGESAVEPTNEAEFSGLFACP